MQLRPEAALHAAGTAAVCQQTTTRIAAPHCLPSAAVMIVRRALKSPLVVPGGGAIDMELSTYLRQASVAEPGTPAEAQPSASAA